MILLETNSNKLRAIKAEIESIKKHTTKEQKDRLDLVSYHPTRGGSCIYGLMTGSYRCDQALELINKLNKTRKSEVLVSGLTYLEDYIFDLGKDESSKIVKYIKGEISTIKLFKI